MKTEWKTSVIVIKDYTKSNINVFWSSSILVYFFTFFHMFYSICLHKKILLIANPSLLQKSKCYFFITLETFWKLWYDGTKTQEYCKFNSVVGKATFQFKVKWCQKKPSKFERWWILIKICFSCKNNTNLKNVNYYWRCRAQS